jgi:hypothetical protein
MLTVPNFGRKLFENHSSYFYFITRFLVIKPAVSGITTKIKTAHKRTLKGTTKFEAPLTSILTTGAKATSIIKSFKAT